MNLIDQYSVTYITPSRSIETIGLKKANRVFYVYNYEGCHFRLFLELQDLIAFFQFGIEPKHSFSNESELDYFLESYSNSIWNIDSYVINLGKEILYFFTFKSSLIKLFLHPHNPTLQHLPSQLKTNLHKFKSSSGSRGDVAIFSISAYLKTTRDVILCPCF